MLYFKLNADKQVEEITSTTPEMPNTWASSSADGSGWVVRHDIKNLEHAAELADKATEYAGKRFLAVDKGQGVWPRFDVIEAPQVGDAVSYGFNGDSYPCGHIASISDSYRVITTDQGEKFYRRKLTGNWKKTGGTWSLIAGHISRLNPDF